MSARRTNRDAKGCWGGAGRAAVDGVAVVRLIIPDCDGHVGPLQQVARDHVPVHDTLDALAAHGGRAVLLVEQVIDAVLRIVKGRVGVVFLGDTYGGGSEQFKKWPEQYKHTFDIP